MKRFKPHVSRTLEFTIIPLLKDVGTDPPLKEEVSGTM